MLERFLLWLERHVDWQSLQCLSNLGMGYSGIYISFEPESLSELKSSKDVVFKEHI